jgi:polyphenol oxidase
MHADRAGNGVSLWRFDRLSAQEGLTHFVSGRRGGVSPGPYDSLNLGRRTADEAANVDQNRERLFVAAGINREQIASCSQVHGDAIVVVDHPTPRPPIGDALATNRAGVALFLLMADCVPVFVFDPVRRVAGLAHAGWRGTVLSISQQLVNRISSVFGSEPSDMLAAIGPSIGPCCYEVGEDVIEHVRASLPDPNNLLTMHPAGLKAQFDLWQANRSQLIASGLRGEQIEVAGICSKCHANDFFSDRAARPGGRFGAGVMLLPVAGSAVGSQETA